MEAQQLDIRRETYGDMLDRMVKKSLNKYNNGFKSEEPLDLSSNSRTQETHQVYSQTIANTGWPSDKSKNSS